jgi:hypothetical protein
VTANFAEVPRDETPPTEDPPSEPPPVAEPIALEVLKVRIPDRAKRLANRGAQALVRCSNACSAVMQLVGQGRKALRLGLDGLLGSGRVTLDAGTSGWASVELRERAKRRLLRLGDAPGPTVVANFAVKAKTD